MTVTDSLPKYFRSTQDNVSVDVYRTCTCVDCMKHYAPQVRITYREVHGGHEALHTSMAVMSIPSFEAILAAAAELYDESAL